MRVAEDYFLSGQDGGEDMKPLRRTNIKKWNPILVYYNKNGSNLLDKDCLLKI